MDEPWRLKILPDELHTSNRPSATAQVVALYRALEMKRPARDRIVSDPYAQVFLSPVARAASGPLGLALPAIDVAERNNTTGLSTYVLCRHRFIDDHLSDALDDGAEQVIILGAGYDSRAYRFADQLDGRPVYEVDLAPLSRRKAAIVSGHPEQFGHTSIHRVEIDFRTQSLADQLLDSGFVPGLPSFIAWEGVAPYLDAAAVSATLSSLAELCGPGSVLAMDMWDGAGGRGPLAALRRLGALSIALVGEPVTFGVAPGHITDILGPHGFAVADLAESREMTERYATLGRRSSDSVYVLAATL
jgi:methyltransferase (TIGR00027 family)